MKRIIITLIGFIIVISGFAQSNFKYEKVDSVAKSKNQIYSDTKMFIAEYWKSAQNVIQNDDKENGLILVKGSLLYPAKNTTNYEQNWTYSYTVKFLIKEGRYKIIIENINCSHAPGTMLCMELCDTCIYPGRRKADMRSEEKWLKFEQDLKTAILSIADKYEKYIKTASSNNSNW